MMFWSLPHSCWIFGGNYRCEITYAQKAQVQRYLSPNFPLSVFKILQNMSQNKIIKEAAQGWKKRTPNANNLFIVHFSVLPGRQSTITEIAEYTYFSLLWSARKLQYKIE